MIQTHTILCVLIWSVATVVYYQFWFLISDFFSLDNHPWNIFPIHFHVHNDRNIWFVCFSSLDIGLPISDLILKCLIKKFHLEIAHNISTQTTTATTHKPNQTKTKIKSTHTQKERQKETKAFQTTQNDQFDASDSEKKPEKKVRILLWITTLITLLQFKWIQIFSPFGCVDVYQWNFIAKRRKLAQLKIVVCLSKYISYT